MRLTRRAFLAGAASTGVLVACGDGGSSDEAEPSDELLLLTVFDQRILVPGEPSRVTVTLADPDGVPVRDAPPEMTMRVLGEDGSPVADPVTIAPRGEDLPTPYYPLNLELGEPGIYELEAEVEGTRLEPRAIMVNEAAELAIPKPGDPMIPVDTPTVGDARGVDPICTRDPVCPFHDVTLRQALGEGRPLALLVATPEFCQTEVCGPVLDVLVGQANAFPDVRMVHAEVYEAPRSVASLAETQVTEAMSAYQLPFEPCLFLADASGTLQFRLANVFDASELRDALGALTS